MRAPTIVNVGYRSTNFYVISAGTSRLLLDLGWPGSLATLRSQLARMDVPLAEIRYGLATHYHPDHAGLAEELKQAGVPLLVVDIQQHAIPLLAQWMKPADRFTPITPVGNVVVSTAGSRTLLKSIGLDGEIVATPGHSDHCVSLMLDTGAVFVGDLTPPWAGGSEVVHASWTALRDRGATMVYPGHGPPYPFPGV